MPKIRCDIVDVYIFRRGESTGSGEAGVELLQLHRAKGEKGAAKEAPTSQSGSRWHSAADISDEVLANIPPWHPVMGHIGEGETSVACAMREMEEEVGLRPDDAELLGMWSLEQVHPYFVPQWDAIVMSPRFAAEVKREWRPVLNAEHSSWRWVAAHQATRYFTWPGQMAAVREITMDLLRPGSPLVKALWVGRVSTR